MGLFNGKPKIDLSKLNAIISKGMKISGGIEFTGTMKISGETTGNIFGMDSVNGENSQDTILIIEGSSDGGTISADHIVISGCVRAESVVARKSLIIVSGGRLLCPSIQYSAMTVDDKSIIDGVLKPIKFPTES